MGVSETRFTDSESSALSAARRAAGADRERLKDLHDQVFRSLGTAFAQHRMSGVDFEDQFLEFWKLYRDNRVATSGEVDKLFTDVDAFCGDPDLWEEGDLDEDALRAEVLRYLQGQL